MIAYKFLRHGAVGPFSHHPWPVPEGDAPGPWVRGSGAVAVCRGGVHACRVEHLPWWVQEELWEVELAGPVEAVRHKLVAPAGRLVRRIDAWDATTAQAFSRACARTAAGRAAAALDACGEHGAAEALRAATELEVLRAVAGRLRPPEAARIPVTMAHDAAVRALGGHPATAAYISAHAARQASGAAGMAAERVRQGAWLAAELGLAG